MKSLGAIMFRVLFLLFIIIPIIEIAVLMQVGAILGAWPTVAIVIITAWLGAKNVRQQGISTLNSVQAKMAQGEMPSEEIVSGILLLVSGVLLVTPGFVTDAFGLLLLVPAFRHLFVKSLQQQLIQKQANGTAFYGQSFTVGQPINSQKNTHEENTKDQTVRHGSTIDGEFERKD